MHATFRQLRLLVRVSMSPDHCTDMALCAVVQEEPVEDAGPLHGSTQLTSEERQALEQSECNEDKCGKARLKFVEDTITEGNRLTLLHS